MIHFACVDLSGWSLEAYRAAGREGGHRPPRHAGGRAPPVV